MEGKGIFSTSQWFVLIGGIIGAVIFLFLNFPNFRDLDYIGHRLDKIEQKLDKLMAKEGIYWQEKGQKKAQLSGQSLPTLATKKIALYSLLRQQACLIRLGKYTEKAQCE